MPSIRTASDASATGTREQFVAKLLRQVQEVSNFNLAIKEFVGLTLDEVVFERSTLSKFNRHMPRG